MMHRERDSRIGRRINGLGTCNGNDYFLKGFLSLQALVDEAPLKYWEGNGNLTLDSYNLSVPSMESWNAKMMPLNFKPANDTSIFAIAISSWLMIPLFLPLLMASFVNSLMVDRSESSSKRTKSRKKLKSDKGNARRK